MGLKKRRGIFNDLRVWTWNIFILTNIYHVFSTVSALFSDKEKWKAVIFLRRSTLYVNG